MNPECAEEAMRSTNGLNGTRTSEGHGDGKRATRAEKEQRIVLAMTMIIQGYTKSDIKGTFRTKWGVGGYQTERYLRLARERLAEEDGLGPDFTLEDMRVQHYAMAMAIARSDSGASTRDRIAALKLAGSMYGIGSHHQTAPTDPAGHSRDFAREAVKDLSVEELRVLRKVRDRIRDLAAGRSTGN